MRKIMTKISKFKISKFKISNYIIMGYAPSETKW